MSLETDRRKRDFAKTPEPSGSAAPTPGHRFVVQRHRASRLHYDFRLEIDGVLMSWAVPKGPSLNPADKRMAVHVEDHPIDYYDFEGTIPQGQYGGGDVIVWDWGHFESEETDDPGAAVRAGELKFRLEGEKLRGRFTLVKTSGRRGGAEDEDNWLLIHKRDDQTDESWDVDAHPRSVKSGRTNDEVKAGAAAVWDSGAPAETAEIDLSAAVNARMPDFIPPMKATLADSPFSDPDWLFELKWDGYRVEAVVRDGRVRLWTRNQQDAARYFPDLAEAPTWISAHEAIVDGEVVALAESGEPSFSLLQERTGVRAGNRGQVVTEPRSPVERGDISIVYQVFDLLHLDGRSLLAVPLEERKRLLQTVLRPHGLVQYASHVVEEGEAFHRAAADRGLEGIVAKHRGSPYEQGRRTKSWLKVKIRREQEVVVAGYVPGKGTHRDLGSLVVGVHDDGRFVFAGEIGSGIAAKTRKELVATLDALRRDDAPFDDEAPRIKDVRWAEPRIVVRAEFAEWTTDKLMRQAAYKGIELGKHPTSVVREEPTATNAARRSAEAAVDRRPKQKKAEPPVKAGADSSQTRPKSQKARPKSAQARPTSAPPRAKSAASPTLPQAPTREELEALQQLGKEGRWEVGTESVALTNLDKVLFPPRPGSDEKPITKRELVRYFAVVSPAALPHLAERALNLHRFPNGASGQGFWQKDIPASAPVWLRRWTETGVDAREANTHVVADRVATMVWLANSAAFEIHPWTSKIDAPERPTYALIDIDPGDRSSFAEVLVLARLYRTALGHLGVTGFPKLTGKRGVQVWIPIERRYSFGETSAWVEGLSRAVGSLVPELVSWEWSVSQRGGRIRLDYTQNSYIKTLVAPYAVRPAAGAPVSAPVTWDELDSPDLRPGLWTIRDMEARLDAVGDLFAGALELEQELPAL
ncbi:MAG: DNA ligase D [Chloroflexi bacterium]|nr:DNA ligase D [Chloroflexota bacterium]